MRKQFHPDYRTVAFHGTRIDRYFFIGSIVKTEKTIKYDGKEYPYMAIDVSSASHPFYTEEQRTHDGEGCLKYEYNLSLQMIKKMTE